MKIKFKNSENGVGVDFIMYDNKNAGRENLVKLHKIKKNEKSEFTFPVIIDFCLGNHEFFIEDTKEAYSLPEEIKENFGELFSAHETSNVYNQLNIRVGNWQMDNEKFVMCTERTTYYNSLVTNRAMDYRWKNGLTTRDLYQYGPYFNSLSESNLSNHLGFNGFVESSDGFIPFIKRNSIVSIGKATYGDSVGASLKTKYALNNGGNLTEAGLRNGIIKEIEDELKIKESDLESFQLKPNVIAAYRDLVEGGKPQLLFWSKSKKDKEQIEDDFKKNIKVKVKNTPKKNWAKEEKELEDGSKFLWIHKKDLDKVVIFPDGIIYKGKVYPMMPSASAAIVMLIKSKR